MKNEELPGESISPDPSTDTAMEVHHHAHSHQGKKSWKAYAFEFCMLFLAVFFGSIAEFQLEHIIEHKKEKQFIHSLLKDLQTDVRQTSAIKEYIRQERSYMDTLVERLSGESIYTDARPAMLIWGRSAGFPDFVSNDGTLQQLKSSGALRLIRKDTVAQAIMKYDRVVRTLLIQQEVMNRFVGNDDLSRKLFDFIAFKRNPHIPLPLAKESNRLLNEAYANRTTWSYLLETLGDRVTRVNEEAKSLVQVIRHEYDIE